MEPSSFAELNIAYVWLAVGVLLLAIEALGLPGVGFLFAGLGAVTVGAAVSMDVVLADAYVQQGILCFVATAIWAALLWKPMKKIHLARQGEYRNIVGETAHVGKEGLSKHKDGEVTWSGTIMKAQLAQESVADRLEAGTPVTVIDVSGITLIVKPK